MEYILSLKWDIYSLCRELAIAVLLDIWVRTERIYMPLVRFRLRK
jgi:hypothetical protein